MEYDISMTESNQLYRSGLELSCRVPACKSFGIDHRTRRMLAESLRMFAGNATIHIPQDLGRSRLVTSSK